MSDSKPQISIDNKIRLILTYLINNTQYFEDGVDIYNNEILEYFKDNIELNAILTALQNEDYIRGDAYYYLTLKGISYYKKYFSK